MTNIASLIERLEKATGPDRELDLAIHLAIEPDGDIAGLTRYRRGFDGKPGMAWDIYHSGSVVFEKRNEGGDCFYNGGYPLPDFTSSIDAALTLVPEGFYWSGDSRGCAIVSSGTPPVDEVAWVTGHAVPAIALCIAALKARSAA